MQTHRLICGRLCTVHASWHGSSLLGVSFVPFHDLSMETRLCFSMINEVRPFDVVELNRESEHDIWSCHQASGTPWFCEDCRVLRFLLPESQLAMKGSFCIPWMHVHTNVQKNERVELLNNVRYRFDVCGMWCICIAPFASHLSTDHEVHDNLITPHAILFVAILSGVAVAAWTNSWISDHGSRIPDRH